MTTAQQKKQTDNRNRIGSVTAGVVGAAVIAGAAVATTMALKDEKTRKRIKSALVDVKDQAIDYIDTFKTNQNSKKISNPIKKIARNIKNAVKNTI